jgi:hypothetical protein
MSFWDFKPYVPVAQRRANALKEVEKLRRKGRTVAPVVIEGRRIATSFWGKAWLQNLEHYADYANRLPRGRTYVSNGSVVDLAMERGKIEALVSGSEIYSVKIEIAVAEPSRWKAIVRDCAGSVGSLVELLQGRLSKHVMERVCRAGDGLFPSPQEIRMSCSCPDWAGMCKHVAATLYGVGARLDREPELLFALRGVERGDLISGDLPIAEAPVSARVLAGEDLAALFGVEIDAGPAVAPEARRAGKAAGSNAASAGIARPPAGASQPVVKPAPRKGAAGEGTEWAAKAAGSKAAPAGIVRPRSEMSRPVAKPAPRKGAEPGEAVATKRVAKARTKPPAPGVPKSAAKRAKGEARTKRARGEAGTKRARGEAGTKRARGEAGTKRARGGAGTKRARGEAGTKRG